MTCSYPALKLARGEPSQWRSRVLGALTFLALLAWTVTLQWFAGAYSSEFSGYPDEPAHYVTGLMVHDYIASGLPAHPMKYAEDYYLHYPKVAFGMWGPLPHVVEGVWMLVFSTSRTSLLLLMAMITATLAFTLSQVIRGEFDTLLGLAAGLALVAVKYVQTFTGMVMADNLCALLDFWAILCFGRYLDSERRRDAILFGVFGSLSVLTKGNGLALGFVPPLAVLLTRRFDLVKRLNFWIPAGIVVVLAGPWQYVSARLLTGIAEREVSWSIASAYGPMILGILGPWLLPFVLVGVYGRVIVPFRTRSIKGRWAAAGAFVPAFWIFHGLIPSADAETRYAVALVAPILMFCSAGVAQIAAWLRFPGVPFRVRAGALVVAAVCIFGATSFAVPRKQSYGFMEVADMLASRLDFQNSVVLISSEGGGEGWLVSEIAMRDHRPGHIVLRASKVLARSNWVGRHYEPLYPTPEEIMGYLESIPIRLLVIDKSSGSATVPHHRTLIKMLTMYPARWQFLGVYPQKMQATATGSRIEVYRLIGQENRPRGKIRLDLRYTLGKWIER